MHKMPLFYFPSSVVWVDDSSIFLESIKLSNNEFDFKRIKTFEKPLECLNFFQTYSINMPNSKFLSICEKYEESDLIDHLPVDLNFKEICNELQCDRIDDEITVLIVDYDMPEMKGTDLCRQLKDVPCKKILLTGAISEKAAIAAFNDGIIDCFILKTGDGFIEEINAYVRLLTEKYMVEKSAAILSHLETNRKLHFSDPEFAAFFSQWREQNNIVKYFIVDKIGNMRTIDHNGKHSNFVVYSDRTLDEFISLSSLIDENNPFLQLIKSGEKLPFFGEGVNGWDIEADKWENYLFPFKVIKGRETYYWCVVNY